MPNILTNTQRNRQALYVHYTGAIALGEVALFIKYAVIGQLLLGIGSDYFPIGDDGSHVETLPFALPGIAHYDMNALHFITQSLQRTLNTRLHVRAQ